MISYIFSENELKLLCGLMKIEALSRHQFSENALTDIEYMSALESLQKKNFIVLRNEIAEINSGIYVMLDSMSKAVKLYRNMGGTVFTAYICEDMSLLLLSKGIRLFLYPFENEQLLKDWLVKNEILNYEEIILKRSEING